MGGDLEGWFMQYVILHVTFYGDYDAVLKTQYLCYKSIGDQDGKRSSQIFMDQPLKAMICIFSNRPTLTLKE